MWSGIIMAGIPFILILALGYKKYKERDTQYQYWQESSNLYITSISKCDEHLLKCGFVRVKK